MPPPRRSALEVSFPDLTDSEEEEDAETLACLEPLSVRKDTKRKKINSLVDARVSRSNFCSRTWAVIGMRLGGGVGNEASSFSP